MSTIVDFDMLALKSVRKIERVGGPPLLAVSSARPSRLPLLDSRHDRAVAGMNQELQLALARWDQLNRAEGAKPERLCDSSAGAMPRNVWSEEATVQTRDHG